MERAAFNQNQLRSYVDTVWAIADSKWCAQYVIGFTSGQIRKRFAAYRTQGYHHIVSLENNLTRSEAAFLEQRIQEAIKSDADRRHIHYRKYNRNKRGLPYYPNYGGRGSVPPEARVHTVYMAWMS